MTLSEIGKRTRLKTRGPASLMARRRHWWASRPAGPARTLCDFRAGSSLHKSPSEWARFFLLLPLSVHSMDPQSWTAATTPQVWGPWHGLRAKACLLYHVLQRIPVSGSKTPQQEQQDATLLKISMEAKRGPLWDYYPLCRALYELPCHESWRSEAFIAIALAVGRTTGSDANESIYRSEQRRSTGFQVGLGLHVVLPGIFTFIWPWLHPTVPCYHPGSSSLGQPAFVPLAGSST